MPFRPLTRFTGQLELLTHPEGSQEDIVMVMFTREDPKPAEEMQQQVWYAQGYWHPNLLRWKSIDDANDPVHTVGSYFFVDENALCP